AALGSPHWTNDEAFASWCEPHLSITSGRSGTRRQLRRGVVAVAGMLVAAARCAGSHTLLRYRPLVWVRRHRAGAPYDLVDQATEPVVISTRSRVIGRRAAMTNE